MARSLMEEQNYDLFKREIQRALKQLYDPQVLRKSPLISIFEVDQQENPASALQKIFFDAIQELKPAKEIPRHAEAWRIYQILSYSYVEQSSQLSVANNMGLSVRQLRRHLRISEEALVNLLGRRYNLDEFKATSFNELNPDREKEIQWLHESIPSETISVRELLKSILATITPLLTLRGIDLDLDISDHLPLLQGNVVALRQGVMNLIMIPVNFPGQKQVRVRASIQDSQILVEIEAKAGSSPEGEPTQSERIQMAQKLIEVFGGELTWQISPPPHSLFSAVIKLPMVEPAHILVIDDNHDMILLLQRYLTGTHYQLSSTGDPNQALKMAQERHPKLIIMDILLPGIDGWELLGRFKAHPQTHPIPVIICTISPEEQLALALGAVAFLRKPVSREKLIDLLDQWTH